MSLLTRWDLRSRKAVLQKGADVRSCLLSAVSRMLSLSDVLSAACSELYRGIDLLKQYRVLNYTAFVKILKKHDKKGSWKPGVRALVEDLWPLHMCTHHVSARADRSVSGDLAACGASAVLLVEAAANHQHKSRGQPEFVLCPAFAFLCSPGVAVYCG